MNRDRALGALKWIFSPAALFWMVAAWVFMYASIAIWSKEAFGAYMERLGESTLLQAPFVVFLVLAAVNYITHAVARFRASWATAPLWLMLPTGLLLFIFGFFLCAVFSDTGRKIVGAGDNVRPPWQVGNYVVSSVESGLRDEIIGMEAGQSSIFSFEPRLFLDGMDKRHEVGVFPPTQVENTYYHIMDFGLAPFVKLESGGRIIRQGYMIQKLFPPGVRDSFELPPMPYRFAIRMRPERYIAKKDFKVGVYKLKSSSYDVVIQKGTDIIFDGSSDAPIEFDGMRLTFGEPDYWIWLEATRSPGLQVLATGAVVTIFGIAVSLLALVFVSLRGLVRLSRHGPDIGN